MDSHLGQAQAHHYGGGEGEPATARSRWAPKPEQILILECIFNGGTVNPAKDETARIRRQLERFGAVRDANVFYWFQNRRSRSRRRAHRQLQQACGVGPQLPTTAAATVAGNLHGLNDSISSLFSVHGQGQHPCRLLLSRRPTSLAAATSMSTAGTTSSPSPGQMGLMSRGGNQHYPATDAPQMSCEPTVAGTTTAAAASSTQVFINGVVYEVPGAGALLDLAGTFGRDAMLVHSSGEILPVNENGVLMKRACRWGNATTWLGDLLN